jgi:hypothetical protein
VEQSGGLTTVAWSPLVQEMALRLPLRINGADRANLETFHGTHRAAAVPFEFYGPAFSAPQPVRFLESTLPRFEEAGYDQYGAELALKVETNYPQLDPSDLFSGDLTGNRFTLGGLVMRFPAPLRRGSGSEQQRHQTITRDSAAASIVYDKGSKVRILHRYPVNLTAAGFADLQAWFFTFAHGQHRTFTWTDGQGSARTVRLGANKITVKQLGCDRFSTEFPLIEEVAA